MTAGEKGSRRRGQDSNRSRIKARRELKDVNDIFPLPPIENEERREACKNSLKLFGEIYFPARFHLRWSEAHLQLLHTIEQSIFGGGTSVAYAFPRGMGKTSIAEVTAMWVQLYGHSRFAVLIGSREYAAKDLLTSIVLEYETNDMLFADFPEVCFPIRSCEGNYVRSKGQHVAGQQTRWHYKPGDGVFTYPIVPGSTCSGSKIQCFGLSGTIRGLKHGLPNGEVVRPDFVLIDDPQTDKSAASASQTETRIRTIEGAVRGLAGPKKSLVAIMPCTVIRANDLAERFLDRERRPEWQGQRVKMLVSFPTNMDLWTEYNELRKQNIRETGRFKQATEFYESHREEMDAGAEVSWTERYDERIFLSAIQEAMTLYFQNPQMFASEYQNEPLVTTNLDVGKIELSKEELTKRTVGLPKGVLPGSTKFLTTGIDVQQRILYYLTVAWGDDFSGVIVDYGTYPEQPSIDNIRSVDPQISLETATGIGAIGPSIYQGLTQLKRYLDSRTFVIENTDERLKSTKTLIDANWSESRDAVYGFCRDANGTNVDVFIPSMGRAVMHHMIPMNDWMLKQGEIRRWNSRILPRAVKGTQGRHASWDGNAWKTLLAERLTVPPGGSNGLFIHGPMGTYHDSLAHQFTQETALLKTGRAGKIHEWSGVGSAPENHWWDCLVMAAVAANLSGLDPHARVLEVGDQKYTAPPPPKVRKKLDLTRIPQREMY